MEETYERDLLTLFRRSGMPDVCEETYVYFQKETCIYKNRPMKETYERDLLTLFRRSGMPDVCKETYIYERRPIFFLGFFSRHVALFPSRNSQISFLGLFSGFLCGPRNLC